MDFVAAPKYNDLITHFYLTYITKLEEGIRLLSNERLFRTLNRYQVLGSEPSERVDNERMIDFRR